MEALKKYKFLLLCILSLGMVGCDPEAKEGEDGEVLVKKVLLDQTEVTLKEGVSFELTATVTPNNATNKELKWESDDEDVAIVSKKGVVRALSEGTATITVTAKDGSKKKATCDVIVEPLRPGEVLVDSIVIDRKKLSLDLDEVEYLYASVVPYYATNTSLTWTSSNEDVVEVQGYGSQAEIIAVGGGSAVISVMATDGSGKFAKCEVSVTAPTPEPDPVADDVKRKLEAVGLEFVNTINAETHENIVEVIDYIDRTYGSYDFDDAYYEKLESLVEETGGDDYYSRSLNPVEAMSFMTKACVGAAQAGAQLSTRATHIYTCAIEAGLPDLYGKFTPNSYEEIWEYDASVKDRIEASFTDGKGQKWVATLKGSKSTTTVRVHSKYNEQNNKIHDGQLSDSEIYNEEYTYVFDVPEQITFVVKCGSSTVVDMTVNSSLAFEADADVESEYNEYYSYNDYWDEYWYDYDDYDESVRLEIDYKNLNVDAKLVVNGYEETFKTNVTNAGITASAGVKIDGKSMLQAAADAVADLDAFLNAAQNNNGEVDPDEVADMFKSVSLDLDVLGQVQLKASVPNFKNLYNASKQAMEVLEYGGSFSEFSNCVEDYNEAFGIKLYFDKKSSEVAHIEIEARENDDNWEEDSEYTSYPVIVIASNNSRHNIEDYFDDEASFSDLIEAVEDLADEFENLYGSYFESEDEYYPY